MKKVLVRYAVLAAAVTLGACGEREGNGRASGTMDRSTPGDTAPVRVADGENRPADEAALTDVNIVALLDEANKADSAAGALAFKKATNPEVKNFAKLMMGEHHALRAQGQQLAQRLNLTPQPPANDPVQALAQAEMAALQAAPKGPEFDRTYMEQEVAAHKAVLDLAKKAHDQADNEELKKLIEQAQPVIEKHLDMAEDLQKKLGGPTA
jgi:putative membrane protein